MIKEHYKAIRDTRLCSFLTEYYQYDITYKEVRKTQVISDFHSNWLHLFK